MASDLGEAFPVSDAGVLRPCIGSVTRPSSRVGCDQRGDPTASSTMVVRMWAGTRRPTILWCVRLDGGTHICRVISGWYIGQIRHLQAVWCIRGEDTIHQIWWPLRFVGSDGGAYLSALWHAFDSELTHQAPYLVTTDVVPGTCGSNPQFAYPVPVVVRREQCQHDRHHHGVPRRTIQQRSPLVVVVRRQGPCNVVQIGCDPKPSRLTSMKLASTCVDRRAHYSKKSEARFKISFTPPS
jgi:hypothetical protein